MSKIITVPNPLIREVSKPLTAFDKKLKDLLKQMEKIFLDSERPGIGLSAVQIGKPMRVFITYLPASGNPDDKKQKPHFKYFVNPEIIETSQEKTLGNELTKTENNAAQKSKPLLEGCLSIPNIWGPVYRFQWIKVRWQTENGDWQTEIFRDFPARVIQHEVDHTQGILFTDHSLRDKLPLYEYKNEKFVEIAL